MRGAARRRFYQRHPRSTLLALLAIVFGLGILTGIAVRDFSERSTLGLWPPTGGSQAATRWWRTRFPPASVYRAVSISGVKFDRADVLPDLSCGSLDGATLKEGAGAFLWGWAYDPRINSPALAVILFDNGRELSPPVQVYRERPDVAAEMHEPRLIASGWNIWLPVTSLGDGREHVFEAFAVLEDHKLGPLGGKMSAHE